MSATNPKAADALDPKWLPDYEKQRDAIWGELVKLNQYVLYLEKLAAFPRRVLEPVPITCWTLIPEAFFEVSLARVWKLLADTDADSLTLNRFRNDVMRHVVEDSHRKILAQALKKAGLRTKKQRRLLEDKVEVLRHKYLSHFDRIWNTSDDPALARQKVFLLRELQALRDVANQVFKVLCFEYELAVLPIDYLTHTQTGSPPIDFDLVLEDRALRSPEIHLPEADRNLWDYVRGELSHEDLKVINQYRQKAGLGAVD